MSVAKRMIFNTSALYLKLVVNIIVVIFTTRIALDVLGPIDFGLFNLIAGVIILLSFLNSALLSSTQRFLSIAIGSKNQNQLLQVFNTSILLHILFAIFIFILFKIVQPYLFDSVFNIPESKIGVAVLTYNIVAFTMIITFITVPYNAVINAREDMWFYAITDIVMSVLKLLATLILMYIPGPNLLGWYAFFILLSTLICFFIKLFWCKRKYHEARIYKIFLFNVDQLKAQLGFTGWNTLVSFAMVCRNQGVAIVLNVFFGSIVNAAYGIANQLNGVTTTFSATLSNVFAPQIIQSKGANNEIRMNNLATFSSKLSFFISAIIAFPIILETKTILNLWLVETPHDTVSFCNITIYVFLVMQLYPGLVRSLYAHGEIKWYQISVSTLLLMPILVGYLSYINFEMSPVFILYIVLIAQILTLFTTMFFAHKLLKQDFTTYLLRNVLRPCLIFTITYLSTTLLTCQIENNNIRLIVSLCLSSIMFSVCFYLIVLTKEERNIFIELKKTIIKRIKR